ncbi:hypothetical protein RKLH11_3764 [Rhodobacteraceae bacterium KLH11]|nr:hypothetical protein RKLH11_3764 [Rhodobacteraceae bacterium KLH11]
MAEYVRRTQVKPLFAWPAIDLEKMEIAISALDASRAEILAFADDYPFSSKKRIEAAL